MLIPPQRQPLITTFLEKNKQLNLSAIRDEEGVYIKHILDSLELQNVISFKPRSSVCDIGTGGGFPLLPLAISNPNCSFTGIDSTKKKILAVQDIAQTLGITNVKCLWTRAEEHKERYDYVTARAVGYSDKLIDQIVHLVKPGGYLILYKQYTPEEEALLKDVCKYRDLRITTTHHYTLFSEDIQRVLYIIQKQ